MALRRLTTGEMVQLSLPWVTADNPARQAILATPEIAGLVPRIEAGHKGLHDSQPGQDDPRLAKLQVEGAGLDLRHDEIVRGAYWMLTALAWLVGSGEQADSLLRLRDYLFPAGLDTTQKTYREESGAATLLETRFASDPEIKKQVKDIPVLKSNLGRFLEELFRVGKKLGTLEDERAQLAASAGPGDASRANAARNKWIRAVNALVANADLAEMDEKTSKLIFGALRLAEKNADRRKGTPAEAPEDDPTPDGSPNTGEEPPKK